MRVITLYMDDGVYRGLSKKAAEEGRTVEDEATEIVSAAIQPLPPDDSEPRTGKDLYEAIRTIVEPLGGIELDIPPRGCCDHVCSGR